MQMICYQVAMRRSFNRHQAAFQLLLVLCVVDIGANSARGAQADAQVVVPRQPTSGVSSMSSVAGWPISRDLGLIQHIRCHIASRLAVPARRLELETALRAAFEVGVPAVVGATRTTNFTFIPAITPGYEGYNSVIYEKVALLPGPVFQTTQLLQQTLRDQFSSDARLFLTERYYTSTPDERAAQPVVDATNTTQLYANTLSYIQLSGEGLLPFSADKQTAFGLAVFYAFDNSTKLYTLNVTDLAVPPTAVRGRKLMQSSAPPSIIVGVWTQSLAADYSASGYWRRVLDSGALESLGPLGLNLTRQFLNATIQLRTYNETTLAIISDPLPSGAESGSTSLPGGATAGIAIGSAVAAVLLVAAFVALMFKRRQRRRLRTLDAEAAAATAIADSSSNDSFDHAKPGKAEDLSFEPVAKLWSSESSSGSSADDVTGLAAPYKSGAGCTPTLNAADVEICTDASGKPLTLAYMDGGPVYRGRHRQRDVAVKELSVQNRSAAAIQTEVQLAERVSRDVNVVQFYGTAVAPHAVLLVMEFMPGGDLRAALDGPVGTEYRWHGHGARIAADVARGLAYIHSAGVVHRDLKSSNVLLAADGTTAKLADFGSAMLLGAAEPLSDRPQRTLAWASPEVLAGDAVDAKADVWSLGVVLWEIATGKTPVRGAMRELQLPADCPAAVVQLVAACTAVKPSGRPSAAEVAEQLQALATRSNP